ncbi:DUF72 domain-containing protein [Cohnella sp. GCM10027633]|uniref:DUF72 domain-containing protein n=1 Tax=unclassified Cohnella TaxID=2636738 RepID=UPI003636BF19
MSGGRIDPGRVVVGLAGWGDHNELYPPGTASKDRLAQYAEFFPVVEVDSSFYAIQPPERSARWCSDTPASFRFVVKAYQGMTGHQRGGASKSPYESVEAMYAAFLESVRPMREAGKLTAVLFQYPPWFDCTKDNVRVLRETKARMGDVPCALEFRHQSWFAPEYRDKTIGFMKDQGWIHSVCDEPQAGVGSVPTVLAATTEDVTIVRMHGRNVAGWNQSGSPNWREIRYLYQYNAEELTEWLSGIALLLRDTKQVCMLFNNNSGGHAAGNAKQFMRMLGQETREIPRQLDLFHTEED